MKTYKISAIVLFIFGVLFTVQSNAGTDEKLLQKMYEEEKMSYDLYSEFFNKWGLNVFDQVRESEAIHMLRIKELMGVKELPQGTGLAGDEKGLYDNKDIQALYDEYTVLGNISDVTSLETAALMEENDITNLRERIKSQTDDRTIKIFAQMERASQNHLRAFVKSLKLSGVEYQPAVLSLSDFDMIIKNVKEKGTALK
ncbi:MAG: DUF2202 domain-containing protein [Ignavibacteria bacterium]|nr:DUF2202 domain-containing protein [Ignavibacteria bacterium]